MQPTESTPFDLRRQPLEEAARRAGELFVDIYRGLEQRPVAPAVERGALLEQFAGTLGDAGSTRSTSAWSTPPRCRGRRWRTCWSRPSTTTGGPSTRARR